MQTMLSVENRSPGREAIAPRPRKSGDFLFPSASREAKSSQAVRHEEETRLQQRLKGHLKEFCREAASTEIKARPPKSDEEICKELSSTEALEMRNFGEATSGCRTLPLLLKARKFWRPDGKSTLSTRWKVRMFLLPPRAWTYFLVHWLRWIQWI